MFGRFRKTQSTGSSMGSRVAAMTGGGSSLADSLQTSISRTGEYLKQRLWIWPILALIVLTTLGFYVNRAIESTMRNQLESELQTLLAVETAMLEKWYADQETHAEAAANATEVREPIYKLIEANSSTDNPTAEEVAAAAGMLVENRQELNRRLAPVLSTNDFVGYFVASREREILAASDQRLVDRDDIGEYDRILSMALDGESTVSPPFPSVSVLEDTEGRRSVGVPVMIVAVPVRDADFQVIGALGFELKPEGEFTNILQLGRNGVSGETYAIDQDYRMVSNSRFTEDLIVLGLLPDRSDAQSLLNVLVVDPEGDMTEGHRVMQRRSEMEPTTMAASLAAGGSSVNVDGYNDYRGRPVIGAWKWLDKYNIGVATEIDVAEAYRPLTILRWTFFGLMLLLLLTSIAIFIFTLIVSRLQREAQEAAIEAKQLGQYKLERKLGEGAMGVVYKGKHAMLRRPTAIKMLNIDRVNSASIQRFEKEVQITCQLNNPHTVAIYDYGRTPEGLFYYAMEFLNGIDLQQLVDEHGVQSESRTIAILTQICESLYEAHTLGLVHRDIKPANVMLNRRGGVPDFIKVLDFGLVKAVDEDRTKQQTNAGSLTGTPLYMSPEAIQTPHLVDARSDIYAVGAIGFFLLSGKPPFNGGSLVELCDMHVNSPPTTLRSDLGADCSEELEAALLACLAKSPAQRPQTALDLSLRLKRCPHAFDWTYDQGDGWWGRYERGQDTRGVSHIAGESSGSSATIASTRGDEPPPTHDQTVIGG